VTKTWNSWTDLSEVDKVQWSVLGWKSEGWDNNVDAASEGRSWAELSVEEQEAAGKLGYVQENWDSWDDLPEESRAAWEVLGWTSTNWDDGSETATERLHEPQRLQWAELSGEQQAAAVQLGYRQRMLKMGKFFLPEEPKGQRNAGGCRTLCKSERWHHNLAGCILRMPVILAHQCILYMRNLLVACGILTNPAVLDVWKRCEEKLQYVGSSPLSFAACSASLATGEDWQHVLRLLLTGPEGQEGADVLFRDQYMRNTVLHLLVIRTNRPFEVRAQVVDLILNGDGDGDGDNGAAGAAGAVGAVGAVGAAGAVGAVGATARPMEPALQELLVSLDLQQYAPSFTEQGYDALNDVRGIGVEELLNDVCMKKVHARRLVNHLDQQGLTGARSTEAVRVPDQKLTVNQWPGLGAKRKRQCLERLVSSSSSSSSSTSSSTTTTTTTTTPTSMPPLLHFQFLISSPPPSPPPQNSKGLTPLQLAAVMGEREMFCHLLQEGRTVIWKYGTLQSVAWSVTQVDSVSWRKWKEELAKVRAAAAAKVEDKPKDASKVIGQNRVAPAKTNMVMVVAAEDEVEPQPGYSALELLVLGDHAHMVSRSAVINE
jgi:hypothetical protein